MLLNSALLSAARMENWDLVLALASAPIRHFHWRGDRTVLGGTLAIVTRAIVPVDPEDGARLQGAARRLMVPVRREGGSLVAEHMAARSGDQSTNARSGGVGLIIELYRQTSGLLHDALGETRLRDLRAEGEAMDDDQIVALALGAIAKARAGALE